MQKKIQKLYEDINFIGYYASKNNDIHYIDKAKELFPQIQKFSDWFLKENIFGIDEDFYQKMKINLVNILKDCMTAIEQNDRVLMLDALEYGISEYLQLFLPEDGLKEEDE